MKKDDLNLNRAGNQRSVKDTRDLWRHLKDGFSETKVTMQQLSKLSSASVISTFPFVDEESSVDLYVTFQFEPFHAIFLENLRTLYECLLLYLSGSPRCTSAKKYNPAHPKLYFQVRKTVLKFMNLFFIQAEAGMSGAGQRVD